MNVKQTLRKLLTIFRKLYKISSKIVVEIWEISYQNRLDSGKDIFNNEMKLLNKLKSNEFKIRLRSYRMINCNQY